MAHPVSPETAAPALGRRERRKLATRAAVREAALRLAVRHGFQNITIEQIATEADIALRTFFNHFAGKEEAVLAFAAAGAEALIARFRARPPAESVLQALREAALAVLDHSDAANREHIEALRLIRTEPSLLPHQLAVITAQEKQLAEAITDRINPRDRDGIYPVLCAATALAALRVAVDLWLAEFTTPGGPEPRTTASTQSLRDKIDQALTGIAIGMDRPTPDGHAAR